MKENSCSVNSEFWLDYMENELDSSLRRDLTLHIQNCKACRLTLREFQLAKQCIKVPKIKLPDELAFKRLENKIMSQIDKTYIETNLTPWSGQTKKLALTAAAVFVLVFGTLFVNPFQRHRVQSRSYLSDVGIQVESESGLAEQFIAQTAAAGGIDDPQFFNDVIMSHQDSDDMVIEATAHKLSGMSDSEARTLLEELN